VLTSKHLNPTIIILGLFQTSKVALASSNIGNRHEENKHLMKNDSK